MAKKDKNKAFQKKKLKVGKILKKTATTDATFTTKKVVIGSQLGAQLAAQSAGDTSRIPSSNAATSYRGHNLDEICQQLENVNVKALNVKIIELKQLLSACPDVLQANLHKIIPAIGRLLLRGLNDKSRPQYRSLIQEICTLPEAVMRPHFALLLTYVQRGLSYTEFTLRTLSLSIVKILLQAYKNLCRNDEELFNSFLACFEADKKPSWCTPGVLECVSIFLEVFTAEEQQKSKMICATISIENGTIDRPINLTPIVEPFLVPLTTRGSTQASPFENPEAILKVSTIFAPLLFFALADEKAIFRGEALKIIGLIGRVVKRQPNRFLIVDFKERLQEIWDNVLKVVVKKRGSHSQYEHAAWMIAEFEDKSTDDKTTTKKKKKKNKEPKREVFKRFPLKRNFY